MADRDFKELVKDPTVPSEVKKRQLEVWIRTVAKPQLLAEDPNRDLAADENAIRQHFAPFIESTEVRATTGEKSTVPQLDDFSQIPLANRESDEGTAGFGALSAAYGATDEGTKHRILAQNLGIPESEVPERFREVEGKTIYLNPKDDQWYSAEPRGSFFSGAKRFLATAAARPLVTAGGLLGSLGGPPGAAVGTGIGELGQMALDTAVYDEPRNPTADAARTLLEMGGAYAGEKVGAGISSKIDEATMPQNLRTIRRAVSPEMAQEVGRVKSRTGMTLSPGAVSEDNAILAAERAAINYPGPGGEEWAAFQSGNKRTGGLPQQLEGLQHQLMTEVYPISPSAPATALDLKREVVDTANKARQRLVDNRANAVDALYQEALRLDPPVQEADTRALINYIDSKAKTARGASDTAAYADLKRWLLDENGNPLTDRTMLHNYKTRVLDGKFEDASGVFKKDLKDIKQYFLDDVMEKPYSQPGVMSKKVPVYKQAREEFQRMSKPIENFDNSLAGKVALLMEKGDDASIGKATDIIFKNDSIDAARQGLKDLTSLDPQAGRKLLRAYISDEMLKARASSPATAGASLYNALFNSGLKRGVVADVLGGAQNYQVVNEILDTMRKSALLPARQSTTAPMTKAGDAAVQAGLRQAGPIKKSIYYMTHVPFGLRGRLADWSADDLQAAFNQKVVEAITSDTPEHALNALRATLKMNPRTKSGIGHLLAVTGIITLPELEEQFRISADPAVRKYIESLTKTEEPK